MYSSEVTNTTNILVKVGTTVIISNFDGKILLERRNDNSMWGIPGGSIEPGETVSGVSKRDIKEETKLNVRITGFVGIYSNLAAGRIVTCPDSADRVQLVDVVFIAEIASGELRLSNESLDLKFFERSALPTVSVPPAITHSGLFRRKTKQYLLI